MLSDRELLVLKRVGELFWNTVFPGNSLRWRLVVYILCKCNLHTNALNPDGTISVNASMDNICSWCGKDIYDGKH